MDILPSSSRFSVGILSSVSNRFSADILSVANRFGVDILPVFNRFSMDISPVSNRLMWTCCQHLVGLVLEYIGVFRIAKLMDHANQDVVCGNCITNDSGEFALIDEDTIKAWIEHYVRLLSVEFEWPSNELPGSL